MLVTLISFYCATQDKSDKALVEVKRPHIVKKYNTCMGEMDPINVVPPWTVILMLTKPGLPPSAQNNKNKGNTKITPRCQ